MFHKRISCRIIFTCFERLNKEFINIPKCWMNHVMKLIVFCLCGYFKSIFIPSYYFFESLLLVFKKFDVIVYSQRDYWDIKCGASNHKIYFSYVTMNHHKPSSTSQLIKGKLRALQKF